MKNLLVTLLLSGAALGGCMVSGEAHVAGPAIVVESDPPPPRYEAVVVRPGFVWITGHWNWNGGQWVWLSGHYERERAGYAWEPGRWEMRGNRHVWVEGTWRASATPAVRDHREDRREERRDDGPVVRDHRH